MTDVQYQPSGILSEQRLGRDNTMEQTEMAAFEKGRIQGELEAIRRLESEQAMQLKTMPGDMGAGGAALNVPRPDVVEINRLTNLQRAAAILGELTMISTIVLAIVWGFEYRGGFGWDNNYSTGNTPMWNTHFLMGTLALFSLAQALLMYRILPLNLNANINRGIYLWWQACTVVFCVLSLLARIWTVPVNEERFWGVDDWCFVLGMGVLLAHSLYSMARVIMEPIIRKPVDYETWAETDNRVTWQSPEQRRDHSLGHPVNGHTVYTPAPVSVPTRSNAIPAANANVGAQVPVAPANAPRWAETPNTHAGDYFLLPRVKWAICGFFGFGAAMLMTLAAVQHDSVAGRGNWSRELPYDPANEVGQESTLRSLWGSCGVLLLSSLLLVAYAAMPPRTTLVKNGILVDQSRRTSISHNAETRLGHNAV